MFACRGKEKKSQRLQLTRGPTESVFVKLLTKDEPSDL